jgi:hypothetical protein
MGSVPSSLLVGAKLPRERDSLDDTGKAAAHGPCSFHVATVKGKIDTKEKSTQRKNEYESSSNQGRGMWGRI